MQSNLPNLMQYLRAGRDGFVRKSELVPLPPINLHLDHRGMGDGKSLLSWEQSPDNLAPVSDYQYEEELTYIRETTGGAPFVSLDIAPLVSYHLTVSSVNALFSSEVVELIDTWVPPTDEDVVAEAAYVGDIQQIRFSVDNIRTSDGALFTGNMKFRIYVESYGEWRVGVWENIQVTNGSLERITNFNQDWPNWEGEARMVLWNGGLTSSGDSPTTTPRLVQVPYTDEQSSGFPEV